MRLLMNLRRLREKSRNCLKDAAHLLRAQVPDLFKHQSFIRGEKFARPHVTDQCLSSGGKIGPVQADGARVGIRLARDLAKNQIPALDFGKDKGRADLALREIRKRKRNEDYRTG
jgi:hypothetical protein